MGHPGGSSISEDPIRQLAKQTIGNLPFTAEAYQTWIARNRPPSSGYRLDRLTEALPGWVQAAERARAEIDNVDAKQVLVVGYLSWWLEYAIAVANLFAGLGNRVGFGYLPYRTWREPVTAWELRRQSTYLQQVLSPAASLMQLHDMTQAKNVEMPVGLARSIEELSRSDVQYTLQKELLLLDRGTEDFELYKLRHERNRSAASALLGIIAEHGYQVIVVPNGSILEFGAALKAAQSVGVRVTSFEFGEQRQRIWIAQDDEVMLQNTDDLWRAAAGIELSERQQNELEALLKARGGGQSWSNFSRRWQTAPKAGAAEARTQLGLADDRPMVLLCTNVVGDSLALNRQLFTDGMADWLAATARHLAERSRAQLVVRVHPGELIGAGLPSVEIMRQALPELPENVRVVPPESEINTYDLMELADIGLVYTTTVGLEMAMLGIPVVVAGRTHYARKGFTYDPASTQDYFDTLNRLLADPPKGGLSKGKIALARSYAYRFFFDYPFAFPWHLIGFWEDIEQRPFSEVFKPDSLSEYQAAIDALLGDPIDWTEKLGVEVAGAG